MAISDKLEIMAKAVAINIHDLSRDDRLNLFEKLWDSLRDEMEYTPLSKELSQELDHRLDRLDSEGPVGVSWEQIQAEMDAATLK